MIKWGEKRSQGIQRYRVTSPRTYSLDVINFDPPRLTEHVVRIVDISVIGVGIESSEPIESGLICFKEQVGGHKHGVLVWCKPDKGGYRAGVQFVVLSPDEEAYIQGQIRQPHSFPSLQYPDIVPASLHALVKNERNN